MLIPDTSLFFFFLVFLPMKSRVNWNREVQGVQFSVKWRKDDHVLDLQKSTRHVSFDEKNALLPKNNYFVWQQICVFGIYTMLKIRAETNKNTYHYNRKPYITYYSFNLGLSTCQLNLEKEEIKYLGLWFHQ